MGRCRWIVAVVVGTSVLALPGFVSAGDPSSNTQHSASSREFVKSCTAEIEVTVHNEGDVGALYTIRSVGRPAGVGDPSVTAYIGWPEGTYEFDGFDVPLGDSLNGTYTFEVTKLDGVGAGDGIDGIVNPVVVIVEVTDAPTCGALVVINKVSEGAAGGPFDFYVEGDGSLLQEAVGSTASAGVEAEMLSEYYEGGMSFTVGEAFEVGDVGDQSTWLTEGGFFPDEITCTLLEGSTPIATATGQPQSDGTMSVTMEMESGLTLDCLAVNLAPATITLVKAVPDGVSSPDFTFTGDLSATLAGGETEVFDMLYPGDYTITESALDGWNLASISCAGAKVVTDVATRTVTVDLAAGDDVTCTFSNASTSTVTTAEPTTSVGGDSGAGLPTTTISRGLPSTGAAESQSVAWVAFALLGLGGLLLLVRRPTIR